MSKPFLPALASFQRRWRAGVFLAELLRALAWTALALLALGVFDFYAGFTDPARRVAFAALAGVGALGVLRALWKVFVFRRAHAAKRADDALGNDRREILSAFELAVFPTPSPSPLSAWLRERAITAAGARVRTVPFKGALPFGSLGRAACWVVMAVLLLGACAVLMPQASSVIARRLLQPRADVPPYTPLQFQLGPQPAVVTYGGEILIKSGITGGKLDAPVRCLTRDPATGRTDDSPAFQENETNYSRKLEKMAAPVDVAFAVGRARSPWMHVNVLMQPKVQDVLLTVQPPPYSGLPKRVFTVGSQSLAALPGSRITAIVTSNRPLSGGSLRLESGGATQEVAAETSSTHEARFSWVLSTPARLTMTVRDVAGTASEPLPLEQKVTIDERPTVVLRQPAGDVLATPDSELPMEADARDDLGLVRVALIRKLTGFRERAAAETVPPSERRHEFGGKIRLAPYGLQPGQTVELTLEAGDTNPNLLGVSVSEPARIHIIDHEQYAQILRNQVTLEEFSARYESMQDALEKSRKSLADLQKAAESGDAKATEEARQKAHEAHQEAGKRFSEIAKDFPIFDVDESLSEAAVEVGAKLLENFDALEQLKSANPAAVAKAVPDLLERLSEASTRVAKDLEDGNLAIEAAKVFAKAHEFQQIVQQQRDLLKDLQRLVEQLRRGETQAGQALADLGRRQAALAAQLRQWTRDLGPMLDGLPNVFAPMRDEGREFLAAVEHENVPEVMDGAAKAAETGDSRLAASQADVARQLLESLLQRKDGFAQMCRGGGDAPFPLPENLASTLNALMRALIPPPGGGNSGDQSGVGGSGPGGFSGNSDSGYAMAGKLPRLPVFGPTRSRPGAKERGGPELGKGRGGGTGSGRPEDGAKTGASDIGEHAVREGAGEAIAPEAVPERYRAAMKRYLSAEPAGPAPVKDPPP
jgi:hypothetical protein